MKKKMLAVLTMVFLIATVFSAISAGSMAIENNQDDTPSTQESGETGGLGAFVFYERPRLFSPLSRIIPVEGACVTVVDSEGQSHDMAYELVYPEHDFYAYMAYDLPVGMCQITATKSGFEMGTAEGMVVPHGDDVIKVEMDRTPLPRSMPLRLIDMFPNLQLLLSLFLGI